MKQGLRVNQRFRIDSRFNVVDSLSRTPGDERKIAQAKHFKNDGDSRGQLDECANRIGQVSIR